MQLDDHFSRPMKEFVALCLKKVPAEASDFTRQIPPIFFESAYILNDMWWKSLLGLEASKISYGGTLVILCIFSLV